LINEFTICDGSKLYFGKVAKKKREIENLAVDIFYQNGFEEIITPSFSYYQNIKDQKEAIAFNDKNNHRIFLRADSSKDVVRLITKRLGRSTSHKKWFYIQSIFKYPTTEINQIGCEWIDNENLENALMLSKELLESIKLTYQIQIGNNKIAYLASKESGMDIKLFLTQNYTQIATTDIEWLKILFQIAYVDEVDEVLDIMPHSIQKELKAISAFSKKISFSSKILFSPLFIANHHYYDSLFFRVLHDNEQIVIGGKYSVENSSAIGFALYTDKLLGN